MQIKVNLIWILLFFAEICAANSPRKILKVKDIYSPLNGLTGKRFIILKSDRIINVSNSYKQEKTDEFYDYSMLIASPSLIEAHTHLFLEDKTYDKDFSNSLVEIAKTKNFERMQKAKIKAISLLRAGFTTIRDLGNSGRYLDISLKKMIDEQIVIGPDMQVSGPGICINKCQFDEKIPLSIVTKEYDIIQNIDEGKAIIRNHLKKGVEWIKIYSDNTPGHGLMNGMLLKELVLFSKKNNLKVAIHAIENEAVEQAILVGVNSIEHIEKLDSALFKKMKELNISFVSTEFSRANFHKRHEVKHTVSEVVKRESQQDFKSRKNRLLKARSNKVNIAYGTDLYFPVKNLEDNYGHEVLKIITTYLDFGFTMKEVMQMLTINGARLLGKENSIGKIEKGYKANIILLKDNPSVNIETLFDKKVVFKNGSIIQ